MSLGVFGKYELLKKVGAGGMGELYLARLTGIEGFEKLLVIKRILPHLVTAARSATFVDMFLEEARLAARLTHPNIVQIHDLGKVDDIYYIAMEYVQGVDLRRLLRKTEQRGRPLPLQHAVKIGSLLCEALGYAHDLRDASGKPLNLVHRDVSPHNVLVAFDGGVKLTDFGIAKVSNRDMQTKAGTLKGKLRYMSPEQAEGQELDRRSDLFAVGVLVYELSTGRRPFDGPSEFEIMESIVRREAPDPRAWIPDYPPALLAILRRVLAKDPAQRYQSAIDLQLELERFMVDQRLLSSATLIGQFVSALFDDVVPTHGDGAAAGDTSSLLRRLVTSTPSNSPLDADAFAALGQTTSGVFAASGAGIEAQDEDGGPTRQVERAAAPATRAHVEISASTERALKRTFRSRDALLAHRRTAVLLVVVAVAIAGALLLLWRRHAVERRDLETRPGPAVDAAVVLAAAAGPDAAAVTPTFAGDASPASTPDAAAAAPSLDAGGTVERAGRTADAARSPPPGPSSRPERPVVDKGTLTLNSVPWSEVFLGAKSLGLTPLADVPLPAGSHRLTLRNTRAGLEKKVWVRIEAGRKTTLKVTLRTP